MQGLQRSIPWFDAEQAEAAFAAQRADERGLRVHLACGIVFCLTLSMPFPMPDIGLAVLLGAFVVRLPIERGVLRSLVGQLGFLLAAAWVLWLAIGALRGGADAMDELDEARWLLAIPALWPIIEHRRTLLAWWLAGFALGHATQAVQLVDQSLALGINEALGLWDRQPDRISGWWPPVVAGSVLVGVLGARLTMLRRRIGFGSVAWALVTILGIVLTGTRGGWLAMGVMLIAFGGVWLVSSAVPRRAREMAGLTLVVALIAGAAALATSERAERGATEVRAAIAEADYDSDTGARLLMWRQAWRALAEHPIAGVGTGGFEAWAEADAQRLDPVPPMWRIHAHAHGVVPHVAATHGLIGLAVFGLLALVGIVGGRDAHSSTGSWVVAGLLLAGTFESIVASSAVSAHWWFVLAICPLWRPGEGETLGGALSPHLSGAAGEPMDAA